ncbi:hypothetical protein B0T20DRAFT_356987 [Sordaria brevicollis]|uniref:Rhodopsin domain-containing protein n=1 Tax=Sordaria brevicollis TaxID=83679 RepID=A0AAE0UAF8_SORBR|nr:hypothetical protein B0T20DRAFT_356987 [Sordaria brevicollis]
MSNTIVPAMFGATIPSVVLSAVFIVLRFYSKRLKQAKFFIDDYILIASWILVLVQTILILWSTQFGLGTPVAQLNMKKLPTLVEWTPTALFIAMNAAGLSKLSFFITLVRVSPKRWQRVALWFVAIHSTALLFFVSILGYIDCNFYRRTDPMHHHSCVPDHLAKIFAITVLMHGAIVEFFLSFVPALLLWNLEMNRREKIGLICAMSLGFFSSILAAMKAKDHWEAVFGHPEIKLPDTYILGREAVFGITEVCMTIIAACIPFLRPLLHKITGNRSDVAVPMKDLSEESKATSSLSHPHTRLGSSYEPPKRVADEDDAVEILETESVVDVKDADTNETGNIVRKTQVSIKYGEREVDEEQGQGRYKAGVYGPDQP